jgi:glycosyltransferase involved in cell wall biosynthesis
MSARHPTHLLSFVRATTSAADASRLEAEGRALQQATGSEGVTLVDDSRCAIRRTTAFDEWAPPLAALRTLVDSPLPPFVRQWWSDDLVRLLADAKARDAYDVVWATRSWMGELARAAGHRRVVVDIDDVVGDLRLQELRMSPPFKRKPLHYAHALKARRYERRLPRRFAHLVVCKEDDRAFFREADQGRVSVVPNGVVVPPASELTPDGAGSAGPDAAPTLLFVGMLSFPPNIDAVRWMVTEVLPRLWEADPRIRFQVVGVGNPSDVVPLLADSRCALAVAPPDVAPFYARATLVVAPLRMGGGTRIKVLEAPARGRALVTTPFAAAGLDLRPDVDVAFADTAEAFAARCLALLRDPAARVRLAAAGRERVRDRYEWATIAPAVEHALQAGAAQEQST